MTIYPHSCRSSAHSNSCPNTEHSDCNLAYFFSFWRRLYHQFVCTSAHVRAPMHACVQTSVLVAAQQDARSEEGESEAAVAMVTVRLA